ncbi:MAG: hypothetical protein ACI8ZO_000101 [Flavobacteriales bacterium]|jgi:hypothetical protein
MSKPLLKISVKLILILIGLNSLALAQGTEKGVLYQYEASFYGAIHTSGWAVGFRQGRNLSSFKHRFLEAELITLGHPKEIKRASLYKGGRSYAYDKVNGLANLQLGLGYYKSIVRREGASIGISLVYSGGLAIGILKPIYMEIIRPDGLGFDLERYDPRVHSVDRIFGKGPFSKGFSELKFLPGLYSKAGIIVKYGESRDIINALEFGFALNAFVKEARIMALSQNKQVFLSLYISMHFGYKWNK